MEKIFDKDLYVGILEVTNFAKARTILYSWHIIDIDLNFSFQCIILSFDVSWLDAKNWILASKSSTFQAAI